jgi:hypothetical protein
MILIEGKIYNYMFDHDDIRKVLLKEICCRAISGDIQVITIDCENGSIKKHSAEWLSDLDDNNYKYYTDMKLQIDLLLKYSRSRAISLNCIKKFIDESNIKTDKN